MTKINPEDIEVVLHRVPMSTYDGDRDVGAFHVEIMEDWSESDANKIKQSILQNQKIVERLDETIDWIDSQLSYLSKNDKDRYIDFEWLKSHLLSIKNNENRSELNSILKTPTEKE